MTFLGKITVQYVNNHYYLIFDNPLDYYVMCRMARRKYKIKTKRKRIVKKYFNKLLNSAIRDAVNQEKHEPKT